MSAPQPGTLSRAKIHELESLLRNTLGYEMGDGKPVKARLYVGELRELLRGYRATDPKAQALADALRALLEMRELHFRDRCHPKGEMQVVAESRDALTLWEARP